jgi:tetratricopeptide (TPR) repeat protein
MVVAELRQRVATARAAEEAERLLQQVSAEEIRHARAAFRRGRYDEAVQRLRGFLQIQPQASQVALELEHLLAMRDTIVAAGAAARRTVSALLGRASALAESGSLDEALMLAREALRVDPTDPHVSAVLDQLLARRLDERITLEKARALDQRINEAAPLLAAARQALEHGYLAAAMKAATAALRVAPGLAEATALIDRIHQELASDDDETFELGMMPSLSAPRPASSSPAAPAASRDDDPTFESDRSLPRGGSRPGSV